MKTLSIGTQERDRLSIHVLGYERAATGEFYDDNWLTSRIEISVGAFSGEFELSLTTRDFESFLPQLTSLYDSLKGNAKFETLEGQVEFSLSGNEQGGIEVDGHVLDKAGIGNRLEFSYFIDQTYLPPTLRQLREITSEFPTRGA